MIKNKKKPTDIHLLLNTELGESTFDGMFAKLELLNASIPRLAKKQALARYVYTGHEKGEICQTFHDKIYDLNDLRNRPVLPSEGLGFTTQHPNCKCFWIKEDEDAEIDRSTRRQKKHIQHVNRIIGQKARHGTLHLINKKGQLRKKTTSVNPREKLLAAKQMLAVGHTNKNAQVILDQKKQQNPPQEEIQSMLERLESKVRLAAEFREEDHPRDEDGKFTCKECGAKHSTVEESDRHTKAHSIISSMKKHKITFNESAGNYGGLDGTNTYNFYKENEKWIKENFRWNPSTKTWYAKSSDVRHEMQSLAKLIKDDIAKQEEELKKKPAEEILGKSLSELAVSIGQQNVSDLSWNKHTLSDQEILDLAVSKTASNLRKPDTIPENIFKGAIAELIQKKTTIKRPQGQTTFDYAQYLDEEEAADEGISLNTLHKRRAKKFLREQFAEEFGIGFREGSITSFKDETLEAERFFELLIDYVFDDGEHTFTASASQFREEDHPRDEDGKFTCKECGKEVSNKDSHLDGHSVKKVLQQRGLTGDALENEIDKINELRDNDAEINPDGTVTVFHRTSDENKKRILETGQFVGEEDGIFFSTKENGQAEGYGDAIIKLKIPVEKLQIDDVFGDEAHMRLPTRKAGQTVDLKKYIVQEGVKTEEINAVKRQGMNNMNHKYAIYRKIDELAGKLDISPQDIREFKPVMQHYIAMSVVDQIPPEELGKAFVDAFKRTMFTDPVNHRKIFDKIINSHPELKKEFDSLSKSVDDFNRKQQDIFDRTDSVYRGTTVEELDNILNSEKISSSRYAFVATSLSKDSVGFFTSGWERDADTTYKKGIILTLDKNNLKDRLHLTKLSPYTQIVGPSTESIDKPMDIDGWENMEVRLENNTPVKGAIKEIEVLFPVEDKEAFRKKYSKITDNIKFINDKNNHNHSKDNLELKLARLKLYLMSGKFKPENSSFKTASLKTGSQVDDFTTAGGDRFVVYFLINPTENLKGWGVTQESIPRHIGSFRGMPFTITSRKFFPNSPYGDVYDHPSTEHFERLGINRPGRNDMEKQAIFQEEFRVGNIEEVFRKGDNWFAFIRILPKFANMQMPPLCSPAIFQLDPHEPANAISKWIGMHLTGLDERPAYQNYAVYKGSCFGDKESCLAQLTAKHDTKMPSCIIANINRKLAKLKSAAQLSSDHANIQRLNVHHDRRKKHVLTS